MNAPAGRILVVDDEDDIRDILCRLVRREGFEALEAADGPTALAIITRTSPDVLLLDVRMPGLDGMEVLRRARELDATLPVIIITAHGFVREAVAAMRAGAHDYLAKPLDHAEVIRSLHRGMADRRLRQTVQVLADRARETDSLRDVMGPSDAVARLSSDVTRVARCDFAVLICGETGTGKELVARAIHRLSARSASEIVTVDCGAIPETLFESELFGHERGAFTGAERQKPGHFEVASGGTLFLDEIGNMPLGCQGKLLRALQDRVVTRVGGTRPVAVNIRFVAATNRDLASSVAAGTFRRDLFFRINEFSITIPPLRERKQDVLFLAKRFLDLTNHELSKSVRGFSDAAVERFLIYDWPGNARELRSTVRRAVLLADDMIEERHLALPGGSAPLEQFVTVGNPPSGWPPLRELVRHATRVVERKALAEVLRTTGGNKAKAARALQIDYKTIQAKLKEYGLATREGAGDGQAQEQAP